MGPGIGDVDASLSLARLLWRPMRAALEFAPPYQGAVDDAPDRFWWHFCVSVKDAGVLHKTHVRDAEVWALRYLNGTQVSEGITLRWQTRDGPKTKINLYRGEVYKIPFALRDVGDGRIFITSDTWHNENPKWTLTRQGFQRWGQRIHASEDLKDLEWRIQVRAPMQKPWTSPRSYLISIPEQDAPNDTFQVTTN